MFWNLSSEHIILKFYYKIVKLHASTELKIQFFYEITIIVFQFTQRAIENRSACHAWHVYRRLTTPALDSAAAGIDYCGCLS
jgi:hypothetical protein